MGAESTFTYQNFNIERGIVWNQENAINRGIQINQTLGKYLAAAVSWNDGYYSNRYSSLSGSVTFTKGPHVLVYDGMGNLGQTIYQTAATPVQNNGQMHAVIYTYTKGPWIVSPYFQYGNAAGSSKVGVLKGTSATGGAINVSYAIKCGFSLPVRWEYLTSSGSATDGSVNLLGFGAGSAVTTFTATPTYQKGGMYLRGDLAWVHGSTSRRGLSLARRERTRTNSGAFLNSASSSAATSQNSRVDALASQQSIQAAVLESGLHVWIATAVSTSLTWCPTLEMLTH